MDHYQTLGVGKNADVKEIKTAFRKLASKHHPDKGGDSEKFQQVFEQYEKEKNREQRPNVCCAVDLFLEAFYAHDYRYSIVIIIKSLHYNIFLTQQTYTYVYVCV